MQCSFPLSLHGSCSVPAQRTVIIKCHQKHTVLKSDKVFLKKKLYFFRALTQQSIFSLRLNIIELERVIEFEIH